jgi:hypothetical protein
MQVAIKDQLLRPESFCVFACLRQSAHFTLSSDHFDFIPFHFARVQADASVTAAAATTAFDGTGGIGCICACVPNDPSASDTTTIRE